MKISSRRRCTVAVVVPLVWWVTPLAAQRPASAPDAPLVTLGLTVDTVLTLDEAVARAPAASPDVARGAGVVETARSAERVAFAAYLPTLSLVSAAGRASDVVSAAPIAPTYAGNAVTAGAIASVDLFTGGRRSADRHTASADRSAAESQLVATQYQLRLAVQTSFLDVLHAEALATVAEARLARARDGQRDAESRRAAGTTTRSDVLRAQLEVSSAEQSLLEAQAAHVAASVALGRLTGLGGRVGARLPESEVVRALAERADQIVAEIERAAPSVRAADATATATNAAIGSAKARYFPVISASGGWSYLNQSPQVVNEGGAWVARLGLSYPLFDGWRREDGVTRARADDEVARTTRLDARRAARSQAEQALAVLEVARQRIGLTQRAAGLASEDLRVQEARYREGATTQLERLTSQLALVNAEQDAVNARFDYAVARALLEALAGRTL